MNSVMRCKLRVTKVSHIKNDSGGTEYETVELAAVYGNNDENKLWSKWTPSASFSITISNPDAMNKLSSGHEFYVDFTPVGGE